VAVSLLTEFRKFLLRGNVVDLAVAVVLGVAFAAVVTAIVSGLITPLIAAIFGEPDFSDLTFTINSSTFRYGDVLNAVISFILIAAAVFFLIVVPVNRLLARYKKSDDQPTEYAVEELPADRDRADEILNSRSADGWKVTSVTDANGSGGLRVVLEK
jgi:large conductance mechanosensitive channel